MRSWYLVSVSFVPVFVLMTVSLGVTTLGQVHHANSKEVNMWLEAQSKTCKKLGSLIFTYFKLPCPICSLLWWMFCEYEYEYSFERVTSKDCCIFLNFCSLAWIVSDAPAAKQWMATQWVAIGSTVATQWVAIGSTVTTQLVAIGSTVATQWVAIGSTATWQWSTVARGDNILETYFVCFSRSIKYSTPSWHNIHTP